MGAGDEKWDSRRKDGDGWQSIAHIEDAAVALDGKGKLQRLTLDREAEAAVLLKRLGLGRLGWMWHKVLQALEGKGMGEQ